jgi:Bacterial Ig-like domain
MKTIKLFLSVMLVAGGLATVLNGCGEDEKPALALTAMTAGGVDLNGATSATGVAVNATIVATFNVAVDLASTSAITLTRQYDGVVVPTTITVSGAEVTIDPSADFGTGTLFILNIDKSLRSTDGQGMSNSTERNFTTLGTFAVDGAFAQWTFEDNANDVIGSFDPTASQVIGITYVAGRKADAGKAASFNGTTSIIEISGADQLINTNDFTISFWVKAVPHTDNADKGHFVMGLGAFYGFQFEIYGGYGGWKMPVRYTYNNKGTIGTITEDNGFNGDGKAASNGGWLGFAFTKDLTSSGGPASILKDKWAHIVYTYNSTTKQGIYYANGEKMRELDFDLWPVGDNKTFITGLKYGGAEPDVKNELAFGFVQSRAGTLWDSEPWGGYDLTTANHFKGLLDDVIIYKKALTAGEITTMYNSGKP